MRYTRKILISPQTIHQMFDLPPGAVVQHIGVDVDPNVITIIVSHPNYDPVPENETSPVAMADVEVVRVPGPDYSSDHPDAIEHRPFMRWRLLP